jgi:hypothetical protein
MALSAIEEQVARCAQWPERCQPEQWSIYKAVISEARRRGLHFAVGGGLAAMAYAGQWRNTKDIDLYTFPGDREEMIRLLEALGLKDYYDQQPYDRNWIFRSHQEDTIVDIIWAMANQRAQVDESWMRGPQVLVDGERFSLLAPEEALWTKLYVLQRDRCDWPDALSLLYGVGPQLDWRWLLHRVADDAPLLAGLLSIFRWLSEERARDLPSWLWDELNALTPEAQHSAEVTHYRARLLDSRPWFTPTLDTDDSSIEN